VTAEDVIALLELERHPEGGWYRQTFSDDREGGGRAHSTAIYYLLEGGDLSSWHRVDAAEVWHWYGGAPLKLRISHEGKVIDDYTLGADLSAGQRPQAVVPAQSWQSAHSTGAWTLIGCTVAPGFLFSGFEMAPEGWEPRE
jgi:predicted cupin superfamily sugar epimerase